MATLGIEREYRKQRRLPMAFLLAMGAILLSSVLRLFDRASGISLWVRVGLVVFGAVSLGWVVLRLRRARTVVTADGITVRGAHLERHRAWHDIYDLRVEALPSSAHYQGPKYATFLYDTEGRRILLPHVDDRQLEDPWTEIAGLKESAARHRGAAWEQRPAVEGLIRKRATQTKAWVRAATGAVITLMFSFLTWVVLVFTSDEPSQLLYFVYVPLSAFALLAATFHWRARRLP
ncbi:PH domain-containing protein [Streptomyces sp. RG80]|uniref:PH domain-containing protein n=1 Tax=Streptomyces sp. RG80 TaxID=3157340 RepID=UPI00338DF84C